ncbi:hypothetical protein ACWDRR_40270 [Kitasatospora sp. NPDC003701]
MKQRRTATVLGAWPVAAALAVAVPGTAYAAHGMLIIDGAAHQDPSGCLPLGDFVQPWSPTARTRWSRSAPGTSR